LSRALVILHKEASSPASQSSGRKFTTRGGRHVAGRRDGEIAGTFPRVYVAMVSREAADFSTWCWRKSRNFSRAKGAEIQSHHRDDYPCILFVLAMVVLTVLLIFFIPRFRRFCEPPWSLPLITQLIIGAAISCALTDSLSRWVCGHRITVAHLVHFGKGQRVWEGLVLKTPLSARSSRNLPWRVSAGCWAP